MGKRLTEKVTWVGKTDWELTRFHGDEYSTHRGSSYNAYLVRDKKTALIDTVFKPFDREFVERLRQVREPPAGDGGVQARPQLPDDVLGQPVGRLEHALLDAPGVRDDDEQELHGRDRHELEVAQRGATQQIADGVRPRGVDSGGGGIAESSAHGGGSLASVAPFGALRRRTNYLGFQVIHTTVSSPTRVFPGRDPGARHYSARRAAYASSSATWSGSSDGRTAARAVSTSAAVTVAASMSRRMAASAASRSSAEQSAAE